MWRGPVRKSPIDARDGMNLVAREYCASNVGESGALILSEFAGAAAQFQRLGPCW